VINVVGDIGLVLAAFLILREIGVLDLTEIFEKAPDDLSVNSGVAVAIGLLLLVGAFAKSAQIPLHTWLADAMEGPTPVSALIHAATMVTAGVYLIARFWPIFELAPTAADIAAFTGLATLLFAGTVALVVTDLKRVIAYSTISQIGYMVVGVSIGAYTAGLFHLMTHAFFKALLFMAAGSVIAAMAAVQDLDKMGGFRKALRFTGPMLVIGALALAAFPGTSGFFSKDEIIDNVGNNGYTLFMWVGLGGAFLTAAYMTRATYLTFFGKARGAAAGHSDHGHDAAEHELEHADDHAPVLAMAHAAHGHDAHDTHAAVAHDSHDAHDAHGAHDEHAAHHKPAFGIKGESRASVGNRGQTADDAISKASFFQPARDFFRPRHIQ
jgi:NADH-quinone oxidoreductase subunit L